MAPRPLVSMSWRDLLFVNWPVDPGRLEGRLPEGVSLETVDGDAYVAVVAFEMADLRLRGAPTGLRFGELNLRTYVTHDGRPAVYFLSVDSDDRLGSLFAGRLLGFPYFGADVTIERAETDVEGHADPDTPPVREVRFRSRRRRGRPARFECRYRPVEGFARPEVGSTVEHLLERYRLVVTGRTGTYRADIDHEPWSVARAEVDIEANTVFDAADLEPPVADPLVHVGVPMDVTAGRPRRLGGRSSPRVRPW